MSNHRGLDSKIAEAVEHRRLELIRLTEKLVQTPSLSGDEGEIAALVSSQMKNLGFDHVRTDEVGNVLGSIDEVDDEGFLLFNGHMDHVPAGDMEDPYSAEIMDGAAFGVRGQTIVGRGTCDMKGALASMIVAGSVVRDLALPLKRGMTVACVVSEEASGLGSRFLAESGLRPSGLVIGECTGLDVALGHRGSVGISITTKGRSCHASVPELGVNALYRMIPILQSIRFAEELPFHAVLGKSSMVATTVSVSPNVKNVVPNLCTVGLDVRNTPNFPPEEVLKTLRGIVEKTKAQDPEPFAEVKFTKRSLKSYTGHFMEFDAVTPAFYTQPGTRLAELTKQVTDRVLNRESKFKVWRFTTDAGFFASRGISTVGFGPGDERFVHSRTENVSIEDLIASAKVYAALAAELCT